MTRDDIIRMAREAGFEELGSRADDWVCFGDEIERFANLVAAAERSACAQVCESMRPSKAEFDPRYYAGCSDSAEAIRTRKEK